MEYVQEGITTLHDFGDRSPSASRKELQPVLERTGIVVPMTDREHETRTTERILSELERLDPAQVFVPVRIASGRIDSFRRWLDGFDLPITALWCNAPPVERVVRSHGLPTDFGKGSDVWLALGAALDACEYVVVHDADAKTFDRDHVLRLLTPLANHDELSFSKAYYARVENGRLYGRLFRLCYEPLIRAIASQAEQTHPYLTYLQSFRYPLAGEFAVTTEFGRSIRPPPSWGLEVAILGDAFDYGGFRGTVQVDLGRHEHHHRSVCGSAGLEGMSHRVVETLLQTLEAHGIDVEYDALTDRFLAMGNRLVDQYHADAAFNGFEYDAADERDQVERYANSVAPPAAIDRLPSWRETSLAPRTVLEASRPWIGPRTR